MKESPGQFIGRVTFECTDKLLACLKSDIGEPDGEIISSLLLEVYYLVHFIIIEEPNRLEIEEFNRIFIESLETLKKQTKSWDINSSSGPFEGDIVPYDYSTLSLGMINWMAYFLNSYPDYMSSHRSRQVDYAREYSKRRLLEGFADLPDVVSEIIKPKIDSALTQLILQHVRRQSNVDH